MLLQKTHQASSLPGFQLAPQPGRPGYVLWPCRRGAIEKHLVRFDKPPARKDVNTWLIMLASHPAVQSLPAHGRAVLAIYGGLGRLMNWTSGRLDASYKTIGQFSQHYSRSTVGKYLKFLCDHGIITKVPRCEKRLSVGGRPLLQQATNAYAFRSPSKWTLGNVRRLDIPAPAPTPDTMGYPEPVLTASDIHGIPSRRAEGLALMAESSCELERTLARWGLAIEAREAQDAPEKKKPPD